jgi:hypothetical protein
LSRKVDESKPLPANVLNSVDLPHPLGPSNMNSVPRGTATQGPPRIVRHVIDTHYEPRFLQLNGIL